MAHYIDKDVIIAEIEERKKSNFLREGAFEEDIDILHLLDTIEVKEVDLETHGKELMYAIQKTGERTKREVINKACEWLVDNARNYIVSNGGGYWYDSVKLKHAFKKAMGE